MAADSDLTDRVMEQTQGASMPSTAAEAVLPGIDVLSNREFQQIVRATANEEKISVRGRAFDGSLEYDPEQIAALSKRVIAPNATTQGLMAAFDDYAANPTNSATQSRFLAAVEQIKTGDLPVAEVTRDAPRLKCEISPELRAQLASLNITGGQHFDTGTQVAATTPNHAPQRQAGCGGPGM